MPFRQKALMRSELHQLGGRVAKSSNPGHQRVGIARPSLSALQTNAAHVCAFELTVLFTTEQCSYCTSTTYLYLYTVFNTCTQVLSTGTEYSEYVLSAAT